MRGGTIDRDESGRREALSWFLGGWVVEERRG
jgi:hypothetical protein